MPYMLLIVEPIDQRSTRSEAEGHAAYDQMIEYREQLEERGLLIAAEALEHANKGTRLQVRDGRARLVDGPFAEAKEMVGGFFLVDCATHDEAVALAEACPAAQSCTIEIRKLGPCYN
jgi:hypothetical protein